MTTLETAGVDPVTFAVRLTLAPITLITGYVGWVVGGVTAFVTAGVGPVTLVIVLTVVGTSRISEEFVTEGMYGPVRTLVTGAGVRTGVTGVWTIGALKMVMPGKEDVVGKGAGRMLMGGLLTMLTGVVLTPIWVRVATDGE